MSGHDPLCPVDEDIFIDDPYYCCQQCNPGDIPPWERNCQCSLIAKVVAREQDYHNNPCMVCGPHAEYSTYICEQCKEDDGHDNS